MAGYYERLLWAMGLSLLAGALASVHPAVTLQVGLVAGSLLATAFLYEALFRNPPIPPADPRVAGAAVWHVGVVVALIV